MIYHIIFNHIISYHIIHTIIICHIMLYHIISFITSYHTWFRSAVKPAELADTVQALQSIVNRAKNDNDNDMMMMMIYDVMM